MKKALLLTLVLCLALFACAKKKEVQPAAATPAAGDQATPEYMSTPLPTFSDFSAALEGLTPADIEKAVPQNYPQVEEDMYKRSFELGRLSADAIFATKARSPKLEAISRNMMDYAKSIGIDQQTLQLADQLSGHIKKQEWDQLESSLDAYKTQVENTLLKSNDLYLILLLQLGGWSEGINRTAAVTMANYNEKKTDMLSKPKGMLAGLIRNLESTRNTDLKASPAYATALNNLKQLDTILVPGKTYTKEDVAKIGVLTQQICASFK